MRISNDGKVLADIGFNPEESRYRLIIWKPDSTKFEFVPIGSSLNTFAMRRDGNELLVGTWVGDIILYNIENSSLKRLARAHIGSVHSIIVSETSNTVMTISGPFNSRDRSIRLWDTKDGHMVTEYTPDVKVFPIAMTNDGKRIIVEIRGKLVKLELSSNEY